MFSFLLTMTVTAGGLREVTTAYVTRQVLLSYEYEKIVLVQILALRSYEVLICVSSMCEFLFTGS